MPAARDWRKRRRGRRKRSTIENQESFTDTVIASHTQQNTQHITTLDQNRQNNAEKGNKR
jgi:hypothetical protein